MCVAHTAANDDLVGQLCGGFNFFGASGHWRALQDDSNRYQHTAAFEEVASILSTTVSYMNMGFFGKGWSGSGYVLNCSDGPWPHGRHGTAPADLPWLLLGASQDNARRALDLYTSSERVKQLQAAMAAGTATELVCKAFVANLVPALLAERGDFPAVLLLTGNGHLVDNVVALDIRTIGGVDAFTTAQRLNPNIAGTLGGIKRVLRARNSALHMGLVDQDDLRECGPIMARVVDSVITELEEDRTEFWGHRAPHVSGLVTEHQEAILQLVQSKLSAARAHRDVLVADLDTTAASYVMGTRKQRRTGGYNAPRTCPVCAQQAWLLSDLSIPNPAPVDRKEFLGRVSISPFMLDCPVCRLELNGAEEFAAAGVSALMTITPAERDEALRQAMVYFQ